ncbi:acetolactate synthase small subunit [Candidatus Termititenax dinenymphae]|uniref:Acetolactate synthase small subunit n=1 Tax=Candidatus Termititenax dinenymphae TaxID=2218523 RepID=A0A388TJB6_9BACT|nr:acetolactate synthase small subunit [Candidatus Termititenax dinenymphae]
MKHIISVIVDNKPGVLARVAGLFSRRAYNIDSLAVGPTEDKDVSRITLVVQGSDDIVEQIGKQLNKLPDVKKVLDLSQGEFISREMVLLKVHATAKNRNEIYTLANAFRAKIIDIAEESMIIEATGDTSKIEGLEALLEKYGLLAVVRTGKIALARGKK